MKLYTHNKIAYDKVVDDFKKVNRTCLIHATGTGKSYIVAQFIKDNPDSRFLFLAPSLFILKQVRNLIKRKNKVTFKTYQYFLLNDSEVYKNYDYIILDEFHRLGAEKWFENIEIILNNNSQAKVLGTTATNIRYLDNERDMAEEIFNNNISSKLNLGEAIEQGIHQKPKYVSAMYNISKVIDDYTFDKKFKSKKHKLQLHSKRVAWENANGVDYILKKHLDIKSRKKTLVFCKDLEQITYIRNLIEPFLKVIYNNDVDFHTMYSSYGTINAKVLNQFSESSKPQVIFSIDMLNEGVHIEGVDTIIMFRNTASPIVYFQQMGRVFNVGQTQQPLIFDFVNNYNIKNKISNIIEGFYEDYNKKTDDYFIKRDLLIDFYDETLDFETFISDFVYNSSWDENYEKLKEFIKTHNRLPTNREFIWLSNQKVSYNNGNLPQERIDKLLELDEIIFEYKLKIQWNEEYEKLKEFIEKNNRLPKRKEFQWLGDQKKNYNKGNLPQERIDKLLEVDDNIFEDKLKIQWNEKYEELKEFIQTHNRLPSAKVFSWLGDQKKNYNKGNLPQERIDKLLELDKNILEDKLTIQWNESYNELKEFIQTYNRYPKLREKPWLYSQKINYNKGNLPQERIDKLLELDKNIFENSYMSKWGKEYEKLKEFVQTHNRLPTNREFIWLYSQKTQYNRSRLTQKQIDKLLELDENIFEDYNEFQWNEEYEKLKKFIKTYNRLSSEKEFSWLSTQKARYNKGNLSQERIDKLLEVDDNIFEDKLKIQWNEKYEELKEFVQTHNRLPSAKVFSWLSTQKARYNNGNLPQERIDKLLELDENIFKNYNDIKWNEQYKKLKEFIEKNNRIPLERENMWVYRLRRNYNNGKLSQERIDKLLELDENIFDK